MTRREVAKLRKSDGAEIRVSLDRYKGRHVVDIRLWFVPRDGVDFVPSRKGITCDTGQLPALADALAEASRVASASG